MQSDTRIFVFRLRQLLTFLLVLIILIAAAVFILFVIGSSKKDVQTSPASAYTAGVYTSSITLNNQSVDIQVVVDKDTSNPLPLSIWMNLLRPCIRC